MPIRPENLHHYGDAFRAIRAKRIEETGGRCELCGAVNYAPHPLTGSRVVLTLAHWDHNPANTVPSNLKLVCQLCHNRHDAPVRARARRQRRALAVKASHFGLDI